VIGELNNPGLRCAAGARIVVNGRSDFLNQVNNSLALIIHERFYCNRGYAAATGGLAAQSVNGLQ
jgi:hypothetical protein